MDFTSQINKAFNFNEYMYNAVYAKPRLSQVNVRQNLSATGRNFGFVCHNDS